MIDQMEPGERIYIHASPDHQFLPTHGYEIPLVEAHGRVEIVAVYPGFENRIVIEWRPLEPGAELVPVNTPRLL